MSGDKRGNLYYPHLPAPGDQERERGGDEELSEEQMKESGGRGLYTPLYLSLYIQPMFFTVFKTVKHLNMNSVMCCLNGLTS